ncbi:MAG: hypothetical protein ACREOB_07575 [Thermodesulfobacteriota bacterium]
MEVHERPELQPFKCASCGSGKNDGRGYIDFGLDFIEFYGVIYLCGTCFEETAKMMEYIEKDKLTEAEQLNTKLTSEVEDMEHELERLKHVIDSYSSIFSYNNISTPSTTSGNISQKFKLSSGIIEDESKGKSGTIKSTTKPGHSHLPSIAEHD